VPERASHHISNEGLEHERRQGMAVVLPGFARPRPLREDRADLPTVVIIDSTAEARVVTVRLPTSPRPGDRFVFEGRTWEVTHAKDFQRGIVARPVGDGGCVH
jgi:hypothetical protein